MSSSDKLYKNIIPYHPAGILFPREILRKFGEYQLEKIVVDKDEDACKDYDNRKIVLRNYQLFVKHYLSYDSNFHSLLIYHGLGSGKTCTAINVYNILHSFDTKWNVFVLLPRSLMGTWQSELDKCLDKNQDFEKMRKFIFFISYNSSVAGKKFMEVVKDKYQNGNKSVFIIDESHNFIGYVYSNIKNKKRSNGMAIYEEIIRHRKLNKYTRIICLSGTPAINEPFELAILYNMLRERTFPTSESKFNNIFVLKTKNPVINPETINIFQRRIMGLTSYYAGASANKALFATKEVIYYTLDMPPYHKSIYDVFEQEETDAEIKRAMFARPGEDKKSIYRAKTKQSCNFVFPDIDNKYNGFTRPRPSNFMIFDIETEEDEEKKIIEKSQISRKGKQKRAYDDAIKKIISKLIQYWNGFANKDLNNKWTIFDDFDKIKAKYDDDIEKYFFDNKVNRSLLFNSMYSSSAKMIYIIYRILQSPGPTLVYSNYVQVEGIGILKIYLQFFGFTSYFDKKKKENFCYIEYHGSGDVEQREIARKIFNQSDNLDGSKIKIILIGPAGAEGINLRNVRQVHIVEPHWTESRIDQVVGRAIRQCSHSDLPIEERHVKIYRYVMSRKKEDKETTDEFVYFIAKRKQIKLNSFFNAIKEVAVDCELFKKQNVNEEDDYNCFKFDDVRQLSKTLGPVYRKRIDDELGKDGLGSNSQMYQTIEVETKKIKAIIRKENGRFSGAKYYWFYPEKGFVYDLNLNYIEGQVLFDEDGIPEMYDDDTYIVSKTVMTQMTDETK